MNSVPNPNEAVGLNPPEGSEVPRKNQDEKGSTPISFTRFVLPFCWRPTPVGVNSVKAYRQVKPAAPRPPSTWSEDWLTIPDEPAPHLHSYFTFEVRELIYTHAKWFILDGSGEKFTPMNAPGRGSFMIRQAGLILFEIESALNSETHRQGMSGDCHGLLIIQSESDPDDPPDLERWLYWNEHYRNFKSPYCEAGEKAASLHGLGKNAAKLTGKWLALLRHPFEYAGKFYRMLPDEDREADALAFPFADGRAFVWSAIWHGKTDLDKAIRDWGKTGGPVPDGLGEWIKHLNVDSAGDEPSNSSHFEREWADSLTYKRWVHDGTLYGFTPHSGALLSREPANRLVGPFRESHFTMIVILLYTRLRLADLGRQLNRHARQLADGRKSLSSVELGFAQLRRDYLVFTNLVYFQQVSNQQQAQEMFPLAREAMGIRAVYEELTREIEGTGAWLLEQSESRQADAEIRLNILAACGVVAGLTLALWDLCGGWEIDQINGDTVTSEGRLVAIPCGAVIFAAGALWIMWKPVRTWFRNSDFWKQ